MLRVEKKGGAGPPLASCSRAGLQRGSGSAEVLLLGFFAAMLLLAAAPYVRW